MCIKEKFDWQLIKGIAIIIATLLLIGFIFDGGDWFYKLPSFFNG